MEKIAGVLGVTLGSFFAAVGPGEGGLVLRRADREPVPSSWSSAELESLGRHTPSGGWIPSSSPSPPAVAVGTPWPTAPKSSRSF